MVTPSYVFLFSCRYGQLAVVRVLIEEYKVNPECTDNVGWTPLHCACRYVPLIDEECTT